MKKIILSIMFFSFLFSDSINIELLKDVQFKDGFGMIEAKPILKDVNEEINLIGEFNVEKNNNVEIKIDKIFYKNNTYKLTEPFIKKSRIKNINTANLKRGDKIAIQGGSQNEILNYLNNQVVVSAKPSRESNSNNTIDTNAINEALNGAYGSNTTRSSGNNNNLPYFYPNTDTPNAIKPDFTSPTTDSNGRCKSPELKDGNVYVYSSIGGTCQLLTASESTIYTKTNQPSCQNIIDYKNNSIQLGKEGFVTMEDNKEYKIKSCQYEKPIELSKEIGNCKAIPNFEDKTALLQKQFYYIENNSRVDVGSCTPTGEEVQLLEEKNKCDYSFDFVKKQATKQTQYYYYSDNKQHRVGECVNLEDDLFKYDMYEDTTDCKFSTNSENIKLYETRLAFDGITGAKEFATDCRIINATGLELFEEFSGYSYKDNSKQAIRKINQYFIGVGNQKIYLTKDVETNKAYSYEEKSCKWEHNDEDLFSSKKIGLYFIDTDENKEIDVKKCDDEKNVDYIRVPYAQISSEEKITQTLTNQILFTDGSKTKIYNTDIYINNNANDSRSNKGCNYTCNSAPGLAICIPSNGCRYVDYDSRFYNINNKFMSGSDGNPPILLSSFITLKPGYATHQLIEKTEEYVKYIRADGTYYTNNDKPISTKYFAR